MSNFENLGNLRTKYKEGHETFTEGDLVSNDPIKQFENWFKEAKDCSEVKEPNAMCLSTCTKSGKPSARFVLLKGYGPEGFTFYTNRNSRKGQELKENPEAAVVFYWEPLHKSVRIEGSVSIVPEEESIKYFKSRPVASQLSAAASNQSSVVASREVLVAKVKELEEKYGENIQKPEHWGGYLLEPSRIEFWQGQSDRLHDRILFTKNPASNTWARSRLAP